MNKKIESLPLKLIAPGQRLRELDADWAAVLAASFAENGQKAPILVREAGPDGTHRLVAGLHRLEAARIAGFTRVDCIIFIGTDLEADLTEIDENLVRRELSELDRAAFLARRKELWIALHPETKNGGYRRSDQNDKLGVLIAGGMAERFSAVTAKKLGLSIRTIERVVARHAALAADVRARLASTRFADSGAQMDALARFDHGQQRAIIDELLADQAPAANVRDAAAVNGG